MDSASEPFRGASRTGALVLAGLIGVVLAGAAFSGDGSDVGGILPVGGAAVLLLAGTVAAVALGRLPMPGVGRSGALLLATMVALVAWTGATVWWSIVPDRTWDVFNKSFAFAVFLGLGIMLAAPAERITARLAASVLSVVLGATLLYALLAKVVPALDPDGDRVARLREPVGYWNALALLADIALALGLWLGSSPTHRRSVRIAGGILLYVATLALLLTLSRAGIVVAIGVLVLWLGLTEERVRSGLLLAACSVPALAVGGWAFTRPALTEDIATRSNRVADGAVFGVLAALGALVAVVLVGLGLRRELTEATGRTVGRALAVVSAVFVIAGIAAVGVSAANDISSGGSCSEVVNDPSRLASFDPNTRFCWWGEAWDVYVGHAPKGAGAGTFEVARKRYRADARSVLEPHSVPLQLLADGGIAAFVLFLLLAAAGAAVCVCALRRLASAERAAAVALVAAPAAYLGHALVDFDWDFLAVTAPTMVALGALVGAGRAPGALRKRWFLGLTSLLLAGAVLVSFSFPRLADRMERSSTRALAGGDLERARDRALWARFFNPLSVGPLVALARVAAREGAPYRAERYYIRAVELQPDNPETWYTLGAFEFQVRDNLCAAYRFLNNAYTLDPSGSQWVEGGPLDVARAAVNKGGCAPGS